MSGQSVLLQPGLILRERRYRESSLLLEIFTRDFGIVSVLAKGARRQKSTLAGVLQPFNLLSVSYIDRNELKTLTHAEFVHAFPLQKLALYCGFYVNELLQRFLHRHDPHPELFQLYQSCLQALANGAAIEQTLRYFELSLLVETGYAVELDRDCESGEAVEPGRRYRYQSGYGMQADSQGEVSGDTLSLLAAAAPLSGYNLGEAKLLLRKMIDAHLHGGPLKSREVLGRIIKYL